MLVPVESSNIAAVGYEGNVLTVAFKNGSVYTYAGVPLTIYQSLLNAPSKGQYLAKEIKGKFPHTNVSS